MIQPGERLYINRVKHRQEPRINRVENVWFSGGVQMLAPILPGENQCKNRVKYGVSLLDPTHQSPG